MISRFLSVASAAAGLLNSLAAQEPNARFEWPQIKGNSGFTGLSPDESVKPPLKLLWSYRLDGDASGDAGAGVIVAGGAVFASVANTHSIVALDAENSRFRWEFFDDSIGSIGYLGHAPVPSYDNGKLILWNRREASGVIALDAEKGEIAWTKSLSPDGKDINRGSLPVSDGLVFCSEGGEEPAVSAFDTQTGDLVWRTKLGANVGEFAIGPTVAGGRVFVSTRANTRRGPKPDHFRGAITALDAKSGQILWRRDNIYSWSPMTSDGKVLACPMWSSPDQKLYLLNCETGETIWSALEVANHYNPPITLTRDRLLYQPWGPILHALSLDSGEPDWVFHNEFTSAGCCTPAVSGKFAYIGTSVPQKSGDIESLRGFRLADTPSIGGKYGTVNAIDLESGKPVWKFPTTNTVCGDPAIAYGKLYFASRDGRVYCFEPCQDDEPMTPEAVDDSPPASAEEVRQLLAEEPEITGGWPMEGGGLDRTNAAGAELTTNLNLVWKRDTGGRVMSSVAMADGLIFASSESGKLIAIDEKSGAAKWSFEMGAPSSCSPAAAGGIVYCGADDGRFHALDAQTGKPLWSFEAGGPVQASPATKGGVVIFGANDHHVYALNRLAGQKLWSHRVDRFCVQAPPVIAGDRVYAAGWSDFALCLDIETGKEIWRSFIPVSIEAIALHEEQLWIRSPYYVVRLDPADGSWLSIAETSYGHGGIAFAGGRIFQSGVHGQYGTFGATAIPLDAAGSPPPEPVAPTLTGVKMIEPELLLENPETEEFYSARMSSGMKKLPASPDLATVASPLALGDKLCFSTLGGEIVLTDLTGKRLWSHPLGASSHSPPAAAGGLLVVGCDDGFVYAFRSSD